MAEPTLGLEPPAAVVGTEPPGSLLGEPDPVEPPGEPAAIVSDPVVPDTFDFRASIPAEFQGEACLATVPDYPTLVKNYVHAQRALGSNLSVPGEDATPEQRTAFYRKLGAPEAVEGYNVALQTAGFVIEEPGQPLLEAGLEAGLSTEQMTTMVRAYESTVGGMMQKQYDDKVKAGNELRQEWGANFDQKFGLAKHIVASYGGDALKQALNDTGAGNHPELLKAFAAIGAHLAADGLIDGSGFGVETRESSIAQANTLMATDAYNDPSNPQHNATVDEVARLYALGYPEVNPEGVIG